MRFAKEDDLVNYVKEIRPQLEADAANRLNGDGVLAGYENSRKMFRGEQWLEGEERTRIYNYLFHNVRSMTALLTNEAVEHTAIVDDISDPVQQILAAERQRLIELVHVNNDFVNFFKQLSIVASSQGDCVIAGPFWDPDEKQIFYFSVDKPEDFMPIWKDDSYREMVGFILRKNVYIKEIERQFGKQLKARNITITQIKDPVSAVGVVEAVTGNSIYRKKKIATTPGLPMGTIEYYYDENNWGVFINRELVEWKEHNYGFVPGGYINNYPNPGSPNGISDIENLFDPQRAYNEWEDRLEKVMRGAIRQKYWGKSLPDSLQSIPNDASLDIYDLGSDEATINAFPPTGNPLGADAWTHNKLVDLKSIGALSDIFFGGQGGASMTRSTGRALSTLMTGVNITVADKIPRFKRAFEQLDENIARLYSKFVTGAKPIFAGNFRFDAFIPATILRNPTDELNKQLFKVQSLHTTRKNLGIPDPLAEAKLVEKDLSDPVLIPEISKQPQMQMTRIQPPQPQPDMSGATPGTPGEMGGPNLEAFQNSGTETPGGGPTGQIATPTE